MAQIVQLSERRRDLVDAMKLKMSKRPYSSHESIGQNSRCCIFKIPQSLASRSDNTYLPEIVSIGPYHHGEEHLRTAEEHKWSCLGSLLSRNPDIVVSLEECVESVGSVEDDIRKSYSGDIPIASDKLVEMMILDGCFILQFLRIIDHWEKHTVAAEDTLFAVAWTVPIITRDLVKVENQIPFFVLQRLFQLFSGVGHDETLTWLVVPFLCKSIRRDPSFTQCYATNPPLHLLDLLRSHLVLERPLAKKIRVACTSNSELKKIHCATVLYKKGIKFKEGHFSDILNIEFRHGVLHIPKLIIDDFTCSVILNCIAYEQCYIGQDDGMQMHFNAYAAFLDSLVNTAEDVRLLQDSKVIDYYYGTDEEVARFCNNLGKDFKLDAGMEHLGGLYTDINSYCRDQRKVQWASFKQTYFGSPWIFLSALAAVILLLLTLAQTFFSALSYFRPLP